MSTRSTIARKVSNGKAYKFRGVYHHWDGYPGALGATLHELYNGHFGKDLEAMLKYLIDDHPAGWSSINNADFTQEPGFEERGFKTKGPQCYCHGGRKEKGWEVTESNASGSGCEYGYVLYRDRSGAPCMDVLSSHCADGSKMIGMFGMGDDKATWALLATVKLDEPAPDWKAVEK